MIKTLLAALVLSLSLQADDLAALIRYQQSTFERIGEKATSTSGDLKFDASKNYELGSALFIPPYQTLDGQTLARRFVGEIRPAASWANENEYLIRYQLPKHNPRGNGSFDSKLQNFTLNCQGRSNGVLFSGANISWMSNVLIRNPRNVGVWVQMGSLGVTFRDLELHGVRDGQEPRATAFVIKQTAGLNSEGRLNIPNFKLGFHFLEGGRNIRLPNVKAEGTLTLARFHKVSDVRIEAEMDFNDDALSEPLLDLTKHGGDIEVAITLIQAGSTPHILDHNGKRMDLVGDDDFWDNSYSRKITITCDKPRSAPQITYVR